VPALTLTHDPDGVVARHGLGAFAGGSQDRLAELARGLWDGRHDQRDAAERCRAYIGEHHSEEAVARRWRQALGLDPQPAEARPAFAGAS
jgi:hypothetical protein